MFTDSLAERDTQNYIGTIGFITVISTFSLWPRERKSPITGLSVSSP